MLNIILRILLSSFMIAMPSLATHHIIFGAHSTLILTRFFIIILFQNVNICEVFRDTSLFRFEFCIYPTYYNDICNHQCIYFFLKEKKMLFASNGSCFFFNFSSLARDLLLYGEFCILVLSILLGGYLL